MAKVKKYTYGQSGWGAGDAAIGKAFFDSLNCSLITTSLVDENCFTITVDNIMTLTLNGASSVTSVTLTYDGSTTETGYIQQAGKKTFIVCYSDDFIYIDFQDYYPRVWAYFYERIGGNSYYGCGRYNGTTLADLDLTNINTGLTYRHYNILSYSTELDIIHYTSEYLFQFGGNWGNDTYTKTNIHDTNFLACTSVTVRKIITFGGRNYYSLSTHILAPLDN